MSIKNAVFLLLALLSLVPAQTGAAAVLTEDTLWVHDPSRIVKCGGKYFDYSTGNNIPMRYSTDLTHWTTGKSVLAHVPAWAHQSVPKARSNFVWAPDVLFVNGRYDMFYSYSTFGSRVSVIGLVTSPTLDPAGADYKWTDQGLVIASDNKSRFNAIDPCPVLDAQGDLWLCFGSWNRGGIELVKLDKNTGKPVSAPVSIVAGQSSGPEASYLHYHNGYYYVFENEGLCCEGMNSTYHVMMGRSKTIEGPYVDRNGRDMARGGGTLFLGSDGKKIGPGCIGILRDGDRDHVSFHYYNSLANGVPTLGLELLTWDADGWPQAGRDTLPNAGLSPGVYAIISKSSGLALGVHHVSFEDGTPIDQFSYQGNWFQLWNVCPVGGGDYGISSITTGSYLDLYQCSSKDGAKIAQYSWHNNDCQRWRIEPTSGGAYRIVSKGGGTVITTPGGTKTPQAQVEGDSWQKTNGQEWFFQKP